MSVKKPFLFILLTLIGCALFSYNPSFSQEDMVVLPKIATISFFLALLVALPFNLSRHKIIFQPHTPAFSIIMLFTIVVIAIFTTLVSSYYVQQAAGEDVHALTLPVGMIGISSLVVVVLLLPLLLLKPLGIYASHQNLKNTRYLIAWSLITLILIYGLWILYHIIALILQNYIEESNGNLLSINLASVSVFFVLCILFIYTIDIIINTYFLFKKES